MDYKEIQAAATELQQRMESLRNERQDLIQSRGSIEERIETIDCLVAGLDSAIGEWLRHFPQEAQSMPHDEMTTRIGHPTYRG